MPPSRIALFDAPSLETTARGARAFTKLASRMPAGASVNIAFIDAESAAERMEAIDALGASGLTPRPIVAARRFASEQALRRFLGQAVRCGQARELFLVGGDPAVPRGPFRQALHVIEGPYLDGIEVRAIGIAGYPQGHPRIAEGILMDCLRRKVEALQAKNLAVEITTQLCFDASAVVAWVGRIRRMGIQAPIRIGVPSPASVPGILDFARRCRVGTSVQLLQRYGWQGASLLDSAGPDRFLTHLLQSIQRLDLGTLRLHLYPLGELGKALEWFSGWEGKHHRLAQATGTAGLRRSDRPVGQ